MDPDVTTHATDNFSTAVLPFNLGIAYKSDFRTDDFNFAARADLYAPPFFQGPGFVGVKYLKSPVDPRTGREVGLSLFSNTLNAATGFPDPVGDRQLYRYLSGTASPAAGDNPCNIPNPKQSKLCFLWQDPADTRFYQSSGPFSLRPGESATIVVAYTHGAPVGVPGYTPGTVLRPGIPSRTPGVGSDTLRTIERIAGWISTPPDAIRPDGSIDETKVRVVRRSLLSNALVAQSIFNNKFLLPRPPEPPAFALVPGNNQVTIVWQPSATERTGDPYYTIASNPDPNNQLYDPNYRQKDVEGYRIYRATGLSGGFELIAQFDYKGTVMVDRTGQLDPNYVPEEGRPYTPVEHELRGRIVMYPDGARVRDAVTGSVVVLREEAIELEDTGVPFAFIDRGVKNGVTYRYIVTAFDVNSLKSGALSLDPAPCRSVRRPLALFGALFALPAAGRSQSTTELSVHHVQEPAAVVAVSHSLVPGRVGGHRRRDRDEASVAHPADHRDHRPSLLAAHPLVTAPDGRLELFLHLADLPVQLRHRPVHVHVEEPDLDLARLLEFEQLAALRLKVLDLEQNLELRVHRLLLSAPAQTAASSSKCRNSSGERTASSRAGSSGSLANCASLPSSGRYWLFTSSGGATMRKK